MVLVRLVSWPVIEKESVSPVSDDAITVPIVVTFSWTENEVVEITGGSFKSVIDIFKSVQVLKLVLNAQNVMS